MKTKDYGLCSYDNLDDEENDLDIDNHICNEQNHEGNNDNDDVNGTMCNMFLTIDVSKKKMSNILMTMMIVQITQKKTTILIMHVALMLIINAIAVVEVC